MCSSMIAHPCHSKPCNSIPQQKAKPMLLTRKGSISLERAGTGANDKQVHWKYTSPCSGSLYPCFAAQRLQDLQQGQLFLPPFLRMLQGQIDEFHPSFSRTNVLRCLKTSQISRDSKLHSAVWSKHVHPSYTWSDWAPFNLGAPLPSHKHLRSVWRRGATPQVQLRDIPDPGIVLRCFQ